MSTRTLVFYVIVIVAILSSYVLSEQIKQHHLIVGSHEISHK